MRLPVRIWDRSAKKMIYPYDGGRHMVFMTMEGHPIQVRNGVIAVLQECDVDVVSPFVSEDKRVLYENDICDVDVPTQFGSLVKARGVVGYSGIGWTIHVVQPKIWGKDDVVDVSRVTYKGNKHENPELLHQIP